MYLVLLLITRTAAYKRSADITLIALADLLHYPKVSGNFDLLPRLWQRLLQPGHLHHQHPHCSSYFDSDAPKGTY